MASIVDSFTSFLRSIPSVDTVDMSMLFDKNKDWTPVNLKYNNKDESISYMSAVIIRNFCKTYESDKIFRKVVVDNIAKIILGDADEHRIAQRTLFVHYSKRRYKLDQFAFMLARTDTMRVKNPLWLDEIEWMELGNKVIQHEEINKIIEEAINYFGVVAACDSRLAEQSIKITFVENSINMLRGYVGFDEIFIHVDHFHNKIDAFKGNVDVLQYVAKMDIISIFTHELAQLKIRKATNDLNMYMHTPVIATLADIPPLSQEQHEFGAFVEYRLFGKQVNWFESAETLEKTGVDFITRFIKAIENQTPLPDGCIKEELVEREGNPFACSGMDIEVQRYMC